MPQQAVHAGRVKPKRKIGKIHARHKGDHIHVHGHLELRGHMLPFNYKVSPDTDHRHHAQFLDEYHEKCVHWDDIHADYAGLIGEKGTTDGVEWEVTFCALQLVGPHEWRVFCGWRETHNGVVLSKSKTESYSHPASAMAASDVIAKMVAPNVMVSAAKGISPMNDHLEAIRGLARGE